MSCFIIKMKVNPEVIKAIAKGNQSKKKNITFNPETIEINVEIV